MSTQTTPAPDLWDSTRVRELVIAAVRHSACHCGPSDADECATERVMDILRDVLAVTGMAEAADRRGRSQEIQRLRSDRDAARREVAALREQELARRLEAVRQWAAAELPVEWLAGLMEVLEGRP